MAEVSMSEARTKPERPWREIAEEVSKEPDSDKVAALSEELIKALDKETNSQAEQARQRAEKVHRRPAA
jgi:hypothetical protein